MSIERSSAVHWNGATHPGAVTDATSGSGHVVLVGGSGQVGSELSRLLRHAGCDIYVVDRTPPRSATEPAVTWVERDLLTDEVILPPGHVVILLGSGDPCPRWEWRAVLDTVVATARLLPALRDRDVTLLAPAGSARLRRVNHDCLHADDFDLAGWCAELLAIAQEPCPPWRVAALCRRLVDAASTMRPNAVGHGVSDIARRAQALLLRGSVGQVRSLALLPAVTDGREQSAPATQARNIALSLLPAYLDDGPGPSYAPEPFFDPPLPVVIPPKPVRPDVVAARQQDAIWTGQLKAGNRWTTRLTEELRHELDLGADYELLVTTSGTVALELAVVSTVGPARPGDVAVLPSFTFRATADVLVRLGYTLHYFDVDPRSWTLDPVAVAPALEDERVKLVVCVDTFGNPCSYEELRRLCTGRGVPLVADSAAGFGSKYRGQPVGQQADAHAFSMSFAKVLTAAGAGGAVAFRRDGCSADLSCWLGSQLMNEVHAIAALDQLTVLTELVEIRNKVAAAYHSVIDGLGGFVPQSVAPSDLNSYVHWVARVPDRTALADRLATLGVLTKPYFPAQHLHHPTRRPDLHLPVSECLDQEALAFPTSSELSDRQIDRLRLAVEASIVAPASRSGKVGA